MAPADGLSPADIFYQLEFIYPFVKVLMVKLGRDASCEEKVRQRSYH